MRISGKTSTFEQFLTDQTGVEQNKGSCTINLSIIVSKVYHVTKFQNLFELLTVNMQ